MKNVRRLFYRIASRFTPNIVFKKLLEIPFSNNSAPSRRKSKHLDESGSVVTNGKLANSTEVFPLFLFCTKALNFNWLNARNLKNRKNVV